MDKKKSFKGKSSILSYLPEEIITEILTRLRVKTLIKFKCVSKSWLNLISTSNFINTHLVKSSTFKCVSKSWLILWHKEMNSYSLKSCSLDSLFSPSFNYGHSHKLDYQSNQIVGSCNGLVCILMDREVFVIWNPSTGEFKKMSILENKLGCAFGFGSDKLNDDIKVVQMEVASSSREQLVKLYSLRTNSWKKIRNFPNCVAWSCKSELVNGALHWQVWHSCETYKSFVIVSLDLGNETYGEIAQPDYGGGNCSSSLIVLEGCISLCYSFEGVRADIWVMKEYGVRNSWVKLYTVPYPPILKISGDTYMTYLSSNYLTGDIFLKYNEMLIIYHSKCGTFENKIIDDMFSSLQGATICVESLVSPRSLESKIFC